jgi:hypothetical protein
MNRPEPASFRATGLQNARSHLWRVHQIDAPDGQKKSEAPIRDEAIPNQPSIISHFNLNVTQQRNQQIANTLIRNFDKQYICRLLIEFIITSNNSFNFVNNGPLRRFMEYLNPAVRIRRAIPTSRTIRTTIREQYHKHKKTVIDLLRESPGNIHIYFDG